MGERRSMPFGAEAIDTGVSFAIWAPTAQDVRLVLDGREHTLDGDQDGWRRHVSSDARVGSHYHYRVDGQDVPDPASRFQPDDVFGRSAVVDPAAFAWTDAGWRGRPWEETILYEVHVGTATPEGTFAALAEKLPDLVELGVTALELMPVNDFLGARNWGYDGVLPFAPDAAYGTPDDLRRLIDRAHALGLSVLLDVVYNHFGPAGNFLPTYAGWFFTERHKTPWGAGLNFDGENGRAVRDYFVSNALYWLREYHFDGLRFDAVHAILDDSDPHIVSELADAVRAAELGRPIHLVLENERNEARWLERAPGGSPLLHDAQWNDDLHHCWHVLLTGERDAYYADYADAPVRRLARCLAEGFAYQGERSAHGGKARGEPSAHLPPSAFVAFLQNHDQIGNRALGDRLSAAPERMTLARAGLLLSPQIPMLFMGEEWAASTPFQFFVDFADHPELSDAVREGRRREFKGFSAFADGSAEVPDPTDVATFRRSVLDWEERRRAPHAGVLRQIRALIAIRQSEIVPITRSAWRGATVQDAGPDGVDVAWHYANGVVRFVAVFGAEEPVEFTFGGERPVWMSEGHVIADDRCVLSGWAGTVTVLEDLP